jgi:CheY-like chemotaxis protein
MGSAALSLVWVAPERNEFGPLAGDGTKRPGNGHPAPSTILVVEDEILIRMAVSDFLRECGYRVLEASTAEEAQSVFRAGEPIEILFSDIDLGGGMNGFALAAWTRQNYPAVKILLASGVARMEEEAKHLCDGPFLQKPYAHASLADHIKRLLGLFGKQTG